MVAFTLTTGTDAPTLSTGADTVTGSVGASLNSADTIDGLGGSDTLTLSAAQTVVFGATTLVNFETVTITAGAQVITSHDGTVAAGQSLSVNASASAATLSWNGSAESDGSFTLIGTDKADTLIGGAGNDVLSGNVGADRLSGGAGNDTVTYGNEAADNDTLDGGAGTDTIRVTNYGDFTDAVLITGFETISVSTGATAIFADAFGDSSTALVGGGTFGFFVRIGTSLDLSSLDVSGLTVGTASVSVAAYDTDSATLIAPTSFAVSMGGKSGNDYLRGSSKGDTLTGGAGNDTLSGGAGDDFVTAGDGNDLVFGGAGEDLLTGGAGNDVLSGGSGNDELTGDAGDDWLAAGDGDDFLTGGAGADTLIGGAGADSLSGGDAGDVLSGGAGVDELCGEAGDDRIFGGAGNDGICGGSGSDTVAGGAGADEIGGGGGADILTGGDGSDTLTGGAGADTLLGGADRDYFVIGDGDTVADWQVGDSLVLTGAAGLTESGISRTGETLSFDTDGNGTADVTISATGLAGDASFTVIAGTGFKSVAYSTPSSSDGSSSGNDTLTVTDSPAVAGSADPSRILTNNGLTTGSAAIVQNTGNNDNTVTASLPSGTSLTSSGPTTAQSGTSAADTLVEAIEARDPLGPDPVVSSARQYLNTLSASTSLDVRTIVPSAGFGAPAEPFVITGSTPSDGVSQSEAFVLDVSSLPTGCTVQLDNIEFVSVVGSATIVGGDGDNFAVGDDAAQFISLGLGDDTLAGGGGADIVGSGAGTDSLHGDDGNDIVFGGSGTDTVLGGADEDVVYGNQASDILYGNQGLDTLYGGQDDDLAYGGQYADIVYGNFGADTLYGNLDADTLYGGRDDDLLYGNQGADTLSGNSGSDTLYGGQDDDLVYGGPGGSEGDVDLLYGNMGNDTLIAGEGDSLLYGGAGADRFQVGEDGLDIVADFSSADGDMVAVAVTQDDLLTLLSQATSSGTDDSQIDFGDGAVVRFVGIAAGDLTASMFELI